MARLLPLIFILSLLFVQAAGVHLHVDVVHSDSDSMHGLHVGQAFSDHHVDEDSHIDVNLNDTAANPLLKVDLLASAPAISLALTIDIQLNRALLPRQERREKQIIGWRPPQRAPPSLA